MHRVPATAARCARARKFFDPACDWAPEADFDYCTEVDRFDFVLRLKRAAGAPAELERIDAPWMATAEMDPAHPGAAGGVEIRACRSSSCCSRLTLRGVAMLHRRTLEVALAGLAGIAIYKLLATGFDGVAGFAGLAHHLRLEWVVLANLFGLLMGFALLSRHFEESHVPARLPDFLPDDWRGGFVLLVMVFVLSSFLDNIAAALIGGTVARTVFGGKVHIGYIAALVAASNAGGSGSVSATRRPR